MEGVVAVVVFERLAWHESLIYAKNCTEREERLESSELKKLTC